jgi:ATP synthase protein I
MNGKGHEPDDKDRETIGDAWSVMSYLIAGIAFWGGVGWLADRWTGRSPLFMTIGVIVGAAAAIYLVYKRYDRS